MLYEILIYETAEGRQPLNEWLDSLDKSIRGKVIARIDRLKSGQFGHAKGLKDGLFELKFTSPAFRVYYSNVGRQVMMLISAGDKPSQSKDIERAKNYLEDHRSRYES